MRSGTILAVAVLCLLICVSKTVLADEAFNTAFVAFLRTETKPDVFARIRKLQHDEATAVRLLAFPLNQSMLAAYYENGDVIVWSTGTGEKLVDLKKPAKDKILAMAMTKTGQALAWAEAGGRVMIYDVLAKKELSHLKSNDADYTGIWISADDRYFSLMDSKGTCRRLPFDKGRTLSTSSPKMDRPWDLLAPAGNPELILAAKRGDNEVTLIIDKEENPRNLYIELREGTVMQIGATDQFGLVLTSTGNFHAIDFRDLAKNNPLTTTMKTSVLPDLPIQVSRTGRFALLADNRGFIEIKDLIAPTGICRFSFPAERISAWGFGHDGRTLALGSKTGEAAIFQLPQPPRDQSIIVGKTLQTLLSEKKYESLEVIFDAFARESQPLPWWPAESPFEALAYLMGSELGIALSRAEYVEQLKTWIKERPQAVAPKVILGRKLVIDGWRIRGGDIAIRVKPEAWKGFHEALDEAKAILLPLAEAEAPPPMVFEMLFQIAAAESWDEAQCAPLLDKLKKTAPTSFEAHASALTRLMPRWGGRPTDVVDYATAIANHVGGDDGDALYARLAYAQRRYVRNWEDYQLIGFDENRVLRGWGLLAKQGGGNRYAANVGLFTAVHAKHAAAIRTFARILQADNPRTTWELGIWSSWEEFSAALELAEQNN